VDFRKALLEIPDKTIEWKTIPNFSNYEASSLGTIRNVKTGKILSNKKDIHGYVVKMLKNDNTKFLSYAFIATK
jgi:hypothetical protein